MKKKGCFKISKILYIIIILFLIPITIANPTAQHTVDGTTVHITHTGGYPSWINIKGDKDLTSSQGYFSAGNISNELSVDLRFANNPDNIFYYAIRDKKTGLWSQTYSFSLNSNQISIFGNSSKDMSLYSDKNAFLVSSKNWRDVLTLAPVTTWTGNENYQKGYNTPEKVCAYPTLIYYDE